MTMLPTSVIYQLTGEQFKELIAEVKATVIEELSRKKVIEKPMTREEIAAYMRIDPITLDRRFKSGKLPRNLRHSNGGTLYFFASEFEELIKSNAQSKRK